MRFNDSTALKYLGTAMVTGWIVVAVSLYVMLGMASADADFGIFFAESHEDYSDSISRIEIRANFLSQIAFEDEIEAAAATDALLSLSFQKMALDRTDKCILQIEENIQLHHSDRERFQAKMDSLARNLYETRYKAERDSIIMEEEMMDLETSLNIDASDYIELVKSALVASKTKSRFFKIPGKIYPSISSSDERKPLFDRWRTMFVKVAWEFPEDIEGYETCLDVIEYVEKRLKGGPSPDYEYELVVDDKVNFRYSNQSEAYQARWQ